MDLPSQSTVFLWNTVISLGKDKCSCWRMEWLPTLVFLLGEFHGRRSLAGYSPQGSKALNVPEQQIELLFPALQVDSLPSEPPGKPLR